MIDDAGDVAGTYEDITQKTRGYFHSANGTFSNIDVPGASATYLRGINAEGEIAGDFFNDSGSYGFTITPDGSLVEFDIPKSSGPIRVGAIGADGAVAGTYTDQGGTQYCFLRNKKGGIKSFPLQQGTTFSPQSIGPNDQIIGYENNGSAVIKSDGTSTFYFDPRGSHTYLKSMNANRLVGYYTDKHYYALTHGFIVDKVPAR